MRINDWLLVYSQSLLREVCLEHEIFRLNEGH